MVSTDVDGLHGNFLTGDGFGQRLFAVTTSGLTIVQLANVPLGIGSIAPASGAAAGGASGTIRGSGFQSTTKAALGGKQASVTFKDMNTLSIVTPALSPGPQQLVRQSRWRIRRSQRRFFCAIISPNHSLAGFILVCENSMREGQCRHENSAIPI
jgi:IPT/TIG domain